MSKFITASSGWYNISTGGPRVRFECSDALSGVETGACPADHTVTDEGATGKSDPRRADLPVIALCTGLEEGRIEKEGVLRVPWPCETMALVQRIEAALSREGSEDALTI